MPKFSLQHRLLLSHLMVVGLGMGALLIVGRLTSPRIFVTHLERMEIGRINLRLVRTELVQGFEVAWSESANWSVLIGATAATGLGYWVSRRISQPLTTIERTARHLAQGDLSSRVPSSDIAELDQLGHTFNQMAEALANVEQRRRELISDLSHELRTPLTVLEGYLEGMADGSVDITPELMTRLGQESRRLRRLVDDLQEISKAEAGYLPLKLQPVTLSIAIHRTLERLETQILEGGPQLIFAEPDQPLPRVWADPDRVDQILINIIGNAIRYTETGSIRVRSWIDGSWVWVAVTDTGCGIAPEDLPYVFERFWRADRARTKAWGGSGLGLAITRRLVELQGGTINVSSQLHEGTTFRFTLPIAPG